MTRYKLPWLLGPSRQAFPAKTRPSSLRDTAGRKSARPPEALGTSGWSGRGRAAGRARFFFLAASGLVLAVAFGLVYLHVVMAERQFRLDDLNARVATEQAQYQTLREQVAQLSSPQQIIATAEGKLHMRQPSSVIYLSPKSGSATAGGSGLGTDPNAGTAGVVPAPEGDANWPTIKSDLAGSP